MSPHGRTWVFHAIPLSRGPWWMLGAAFLFALMGLAVKQASADVGAGQIVWWRNLIQLVGILAIAIPRGVSLKVERVGPLVWRCLFGVSAMICYFAAIGRLPLGDAVLLTYTMPLFVAWFSPAVTGEARAERLGPALLVGLVGVALVADPRWTPDGWGVLLGLLAAAGSGTAYVWLRVTTRTEPRERIIAWFSLTCVVVTTPSWGWDAPGWEPVTLAWLLAVGLLGLAASLMLTVAYEEGPADVVAMFGYSTPVWAYLLGTWWLDEPMTWRAMAGVGLVALGGMIVRRT